MILRGVTLALICLLLLTPPITAQPQRPTPTAYNVQYDDDNGRRRLDIYLPETGAGPFPVVVMLHGSGSDKSEMVSGGAVRVVIDAGYAAVPINYTTLLPTAYLDGMCALSWLIASAADYNLDPERIALFGTSFGGMVSGFLAAIDQPSLLTDDCQHPLPEDFALRGIVSHAGPATTDREFVLGLLIEAIDGVRLTDDEIAAVTALLDATPPTDWRGLTFTASLDVHLLIGQSTLYWLDQGDPPALIIHGLGDTVVPYSEAFEYAQALSAVNVDSQIILEHAVGHVPPPRTYEDELPVFLARIFD